MLELYSFFSLGLLCLMALVVSPQAVGFCCFWLVLLGCLVVGYRGIA